MFRLKPQTKEEYISWGLVPMKFFADWRELSDDAFFERVEQYDTQTYSLPTEHILNELRSRNLTRSDFPTIKTFMLYVLKNTKGCVNPNALIECWELLK